MKFVHLHTHSHFSLLDGLIKIDELVSRAKELGMEALALTDHGNLYGAVEFYKKAIKAGIKPILGMEAYIAPSSRFEKNGKENKYRHLTLLAENQTGWQNLIKISTKAHLEGFYYKPRADKELLKQYSEGLIAMSGCLGGEIPQLILENKFTDAEKVAREYQNIFGENNFFLEVWHHPNIEGMEKVKNGIIDLGKKLNIPLVATQDIHYLNSDDGKYHDILLAVQTGNKVEDDDRLSLRADDFSMRPPEIMAELFKDLPEALENTNKISSRCDVKLSIGKIHLPKFSLPEGETNSNKFLRKLIDEQISRRFPEISEEIKNRFEYELGVIENMGFADYFLIVSDFVNWAKAHGIMVGPGRGSAAGSIISYILGITDVDPLKYDLLFERFLNPDRIQLPDIDLDFADTRRDEVLDYVRNKYGEDKVAQIITFGTMAARASIRDAGRALGMPYSFCDQIAKLIPFNMDLAQSLEAVSELRQLYETSPDAKKIIDAAKKLEGVARHASVHACGVVISNEELINYLPLQRSPQQENITITQFEMHNVEDLGLLKIDILGLKNLTIIEDVVRLVREIKGEEIKISEIPLDNPETFKLFQKGDCVGVFQFESSGMRRYLKDLKPTEFDDVVAMVALYRPGPLEAGMVPRYIARKHGEELVEYLHPRLEPILKGTYGIGIYQEQMMKIARDLAGFTLSEADTLRKAIGKKIKELLDAQKEKLIQGMINNGIEEKSANEIWELFPSFARYGFNKSHSVCYALIGYQTAYLKAHYPLEFMTALFNADSGDVERAAFLITEAKKMGIAVLPPDINSSFTKFTPEGKNIRFGLLAIKNVGTNIVEAIIEERQRGGPFLELIDFLKRVTHKDLNKKSLESLIKAGVFDSLKISRGKLLANLDEILRFSQQNKKSADTTQNNLFGDTYFGGALSLKADMPISSKDRLLWEKELLGLFVSGHPMNEYAAKLEEKNVQFIRELVANGNGKGGYNKRHRIAGVITKIQKILTKTGQPMIFAKVEDFDSEIEVLVFNSALTKTSDIWKENNIIIGEGRVSWKDDQPKFICEDAAILT
ncbi:MAG: DNA polymerase III subunit alpha [Candidatus Wolfebacteria bacterium]|nr:DNA polymerase III subunit alpha [Candidatus Wolfebacteria bacterium]